MLKAAWMAKNGENDQYFCVNDDEKEEKDWLLSIPDTADDIASLKNAKKADVRLASLRMTLESDAELRVMTGYGREEFGRLYRAFVKTWEIMEGEELKRREQYARRRAGKRGPRPQQTRTRTIS